MGYKPKYDIETYMDALTPEDLKADFESYGFEVEIKIESEEVERNGKA